MKNRDIQREILTKLLQSNVLRYRDAMPDDIPNDLYNYHLQFLVKKGLIKKDDDGYALTHEGKHFVEVVEPLDPLGGGSDLFRVNILACVLRCTSAGIEILNQTRKRHPYYGDTGVIGGSVHEGEPVIAAARRKLIQETGLEADFVHVGNIRKMRFTVSSELFSDIFFHVCISDALTGGTLIPSTSFGENAWVGIETAIENESRAVQGSEKVVEVLRLISHTPFRSIPFFFAEEKKILSAV